MEKPFRNYFLILGKIVDILLKVSILFLFFFYLFFASSFIEFHQYVMPVTSFFSKLIPYVYWFVDESNSPNLMRAFMEIFYSLFIVMFMNIFIFSFPAKKNISNKKYEISLVSYGRFLKDVFYTDIKPIFTIDDDLIGAKQFSAAFRDVFIEKTKTKEIIMGYLRKHFSYYLIALLVAFVLFPFIAHDLINKTGLVKFWIVAIIFIYLQVFVLFELLMIFLSLFFEERE